MLGANIGSLVDIWPMVAWYGYSNIVFLLIFHNHSHVLFDNACMDVTFHYIKLASPHQRMLYVKYGWNFPIDIPVYAAAVEEFFLKIWTIEQKIFVSAELILYTTI